MSAKIDWFQAIQEKQRLYRFGSMNICSWRIFYDANKKSWHNSAREISVSFNNQRYDFITSDAIHFWIFCKTENILIKLKIGAFQPPWWLTLIFRSLQFKTSFLQQAEKTTSFIKKLQVSCCKCEGRIIFKWSFIALNQCLRRL